MSFGFNGKQERLIIENALSKNTREPFSLEGIHVYTGDDINAQASFVPLCQPQLFFVSYEDRRNFLSWVCVQ